MMWLMDVVRFHFETFAHGADPDQMPQNIIPHFGIALPAIIKSKLLTGKVLIFEPATPH